MKKLSKKVLLTIIIAVILLFIVFFKISFCKELMSSKETINMSNNDIENLDEQKMESGKEISKLNVEKQEKSDDETIEQKEIGQENQEGLENEIKTEKIEQENYKDQSDEENQINKKIEIIENTFKEIVERIYVSNESNVKGTEYITASTDSSYQYPDEWLEEFNEKIIQFQMEFPDGMYWNHMGSTQNEIGVTDQPCSHSKNGEKYCNHYQGISTKICGFYMGTQCAGFVSMLSDRIFGTDAPTRIFTNYDDIRIGDQARVNNNSHTVFIIDKTDEYVVVAECNADYETCEINWGRKIERSQLSGYYITRWD